MVLTAQLLASLAVRMLARDEVVFQRQNRHPVRGAPEPAQGGDEVVFCKLKQILHNAPLMLRLAGPALMFWPSSAGAERESVTNT